MFFQKLLFGKHLEEGETLLFVVHKHWITIFKETLELGFFGLLLPWGLYAIGFNKPLFLWLAVIWSGLAYLRYLYILMTWYSDAWLITSANIIAIQWEGFFKNRSARTEYEDIEGFHYEIIGVWATLLGYGEMSIKLASGGHVHLHPVGNPKDKEHELMHFQNKILDERNSKTSAGLQDMISTMVAHHMRKKLK